MTLPRPLLSNSNLEVSPPEALAPTAAVADDCVGDEDDFDEEEVKVDEMLEVEIVLLGVDDVPV